MPQTKLFSLVSLSLSSFAIWLYILTQVQPNREDIVIMVTFFASLIGWLGILLSSLIYVFKVRRGNREIVYAHINPSTRQGFLIALAVAGLLYLQFLRVLSLWDAGLLICVFVLFEIAFRSSDNKKGIA